MNHYRFTQTKEKIDKLIVKINRRYIMIGIAFVFVMIVIAFRLFDIQVKQHSFYLQQAYSTSDTSQFQPATRGQIIDSKNQVLVSNKEVLSFIYLSPSNETEKTRMEKAIAFVDLFDIDHSSMTFRDRQDAFILMFPEKALELLANEDLDKLSDDQIYRLQLKKITDDILNATMSDRDYKIAMTVFRMRQSKSLDVVLKENVTVQQVTQLLEHADQFTGIQPYLNWERVDSQQHNLGSVIGSITTSRQGLLLESSTYYQALGYRLNHRIGKDGLEMVYEGLLKGKPTRYDFTYNDKGEVSISEINPGQKGDTLQLSIHQKFQHAVEDIAANFLVEHKQLPYRDYFNSLYIVVSNPNTGAILANVAVTANAENKVFYIPSATYLDAFMVGSSVKGAMVYLFLNEGVFAPGELVLDEPIKIQGTSVKRSSAELGYVDDLRALSESSNVYMFKGVIKLGNGVYQYDAPLDISASTFSKVRSNFSQFGLGVSTGIDVAYEALGYQSSSTLPGHLLDYTIGQFDTYTAMQLNQYISTLANGKYRYKSHFVNQSYDSLTGGINYQHNPEILNIIDNQEAVSRVQQGFRQCVTEGYCQYLNDTPFPVAAKTGTAESFVIVDSETISTSNSTAISYGPYEDPQLAISCIAPNYTHTVGQSNPCLRVIHSIYQVADQMKLVR